MTTAEPSGGAKPGGRRQPDNRVHRPLAQAASDIGTSAQIPVSGRSWRRRSWHTRTAFGYCGEPDPAGPPGSFASR